MSDERKPTDEVVYLFDPTFTVRHQFWDTEKGFAHRISVQDRCRRGDIVCESDWCSYLMIAKVECRGVEFAATTEYYKGVLPDVFRVEQGRLQ